MNLPHEFDKVTVTGYYDDDDRCRQIFVYLNGDDVTARDVAEAVRAVFRPDVTQRDRSHGDTRAFPQIGVNGHAVAPPSELDDKDWFRQ
jgi:hypothetical protein